MAEIHCGNAATYGFDCAACTGYRGAYDTFRCDCTCHDEPRSTT